MHFFVLQINVTAKLMGHPWKSNRAGIGQMQFLYRAIQKSENVWFKSPRNRGELIDHFEMFLSVLVILEPDVGEKKDFC